MIEVTIYVNPSNMFAEAEEGLNAVFDAVAKADGTYRKPCSCCNGTGLESEQL